MGCDEIMFQINYKSILKNVFIDRKDQYILGPYTWRIMKAGKSFYVIAHTPMINKKRTTILLHKYLTGFKFTDHINGNGLDNRRKNLRKSNHRLNAQNRTRLLDKKQSKYKGVLRNNQVFTKITWMARITINGKMKHLGSFNNEIDAAKAYNKAAKKYFKEYACLNKLEV